MFCRNGLLSWFQPGFSRFLSLPTQVSTTMRRPADSITKQWIDINSRSRSFAKCGLSQAWRATRSAGGSLNKDFGEVGTGPISTT